MRSWLLFTACCVGCWTGSPPPAAPEPTSATASSSHARPLRFRITLERTACLGRCPVYAVAIEGDGRVQWEGIENVAAVGKLAGHPVPRRELDELVHRVQQARFFERDEAGELPSGPTCTTVNGTTTCSYSAHFCSDTPHSRVTVNWANKTHTIENDHCDAKPGIDELETLVDQLAGTAEYIGP